MLIHVSECMTDEMLVYWKDRIRQHLRSPYTSDSGRAMVGPLLYVETGPILDNVYPQEIQPGGLIEAYTLKRHWKKYNFHVLREK